MPKLRRPHVASPDEVRITRQGDTAIFEYADPGIATTHFTMEPGLLARMTEPELLAYWNEHIGALAARVREAGNGPRYTVSVDAERRAQANWTGR